MTLHIEAVYDGKAFIPTKPIKLKPNSRVRIAVETEEERPVSFLEVAQSLQLDGPPDWSTNLDASKIESGYQLPGSSELPGSLGVR